MATLTLACLALLAFVGARAWPRSRRHKHEEAFNSVQRGHQNMLESWGPVCCLLLANGLVFPRLAAVCGVLYSVGRILYSRGYKTPLKHHLMVRALYKTPLNGARTIKWCAHYIKHH